MNALYTQLFFTFHAQGGLNNYNFLVKHCQVYCVITSDYSPCIIDLTLLKADCIISFFERKQYFESTKRVKVVLLL